MLLALAAVFEEAGFRVIRHTLDFRKRKPNGPPHPKDAEADRAGLYDEVIALRRDGCERVFVGGHSYGGRQASMLAAEEYGVAAALLLLSYPLHPPDKPADLRTLHFPALRTPALFIHGTKDKFATPAELAQAVTAIPGPVRIMLLEGAAHEIGRGRIDFASTFEQLRKWTES